VRQIGDEALFFRSPERHAVDVDDAAAGPLEAARGEGGVFGDTAADGGVRNLEEDGCDAAFEGSGSGRVSVMLSRSVMEQFDLEKAQMR
jgi:hypothetical protein